MLYLPFILYYIILLRNYFTLHYKILLHYFITKDKGKDKVLNFITYCSQAYTIYIYNATIV